MVENEWHNLGDGGHLPGVIANWSNIAREHQIKLDRIAHRVTSGRVGDSMLLHELAKLRSGILIQLEV
jgi:hypothetical protein